MRILILAGWYPNQNNPMKGIFVREQAKALAAAGLSIAVYYPFDEEIPSGQMSVRTEDGITVFRMNTYGAGNRYLARFASYYTAHKKLSEVAEIFKPELIHVHVSYPAGIIAYLFFRSHHVPYVITEHMSYLKDYTDKWQHRVLLRPAFEQAARVLPVSEALAEQIKGFGWKVNVQTLPNVVDTDRFTNDEVHEERLDNDPINLLFVGSMEETQIKGLQYLLPAFAEVLKADRVETGGKHANKKLHLHCVGDGPKRHEYEKLAEDLGIKAFCTFYGRVNPERMPAYYRLADLVIVSSLKETFGCVLIEAMACGKPVVATACGGPQGIVRNGVGVLVEPGSKDELASGIKEVLSSLESYRPDEIRRYAIESYSPQAIAGALADIYREILH